MFNSITILAYRRQRFASCAALYTLPKALDIKMYSKKGAPGRPFKPFINIALHRL